MPRLTCASVSISALSLASVFDGTPGAGGQPSRSYANSMAVGDLNDR